ncbi:stage V sporulation protein AE [Bacillus sp. FJAT-42376]|uniref:stage V sporulation protein AE n=1 Tax=Bacillus sp. FJAT-42376 TaxID=2014076 RepID=UPI000F4E2B37|nr:stage V sporulation protein AE [Bacillus sp. FJAT-42376]AZB43404.1 stage V sporulation protein AE [Bacillus sp. FJAT-42376]
MKRRVILVTDGDEYAAKNIAYTAEQIGGRWISQSQGNPSRLSGKELVTLILTTPYDPVFVLFDDCGMPGEGPGEKAMMYVAEHPDIEVLGVIAVAAKTRQSDWARVDVCIDREGELTGHGVDKSGIQELEDGRINGDTVYSLDRLNVPIIVGIGDIGKMARRDDVKQGAPITMKAAEIILERNGIDARKHQK